MALNDYVNPLSNTSYVNKDFQTIYPELLDYVKKVSYKWDPSISDESDPGVILLKLAAILADKNNYISDINVLETFPQSVTQQSNARQLFEQLGYNMKWYQAASTTVSFKWIGDRDIDKKYTYTIPQFTMLSDDERSIVYTITSQVQISSEGETADCQALQGIYTEYTINGDRNITTANFDSKNRLYFSDYNVAENGIFICNAGSANYSDWTQVNNLAVEQLGNKVYKFGVSKDGGSCYIEFPDDAEDLIGEGLNISYLVTQGYEGNVATGAIEKIYNELLIQDPADPETTIILNSDNVKIANFDPVQNGKNPEDIDSAYKNYKKTIGVFNTLVTKRDYANYINTLNLVSNCFVCDRNSDLQNAYYVISDQGSLTKRILTNDISDETVIVYDNQGNRLDTISPMIISSTTLTQEQIRQFEITSEEYLKYLENNDSVQKRNYFLIGSDIDLSSYVGVTKDLASAKRDETVECVVHVHPDSNDSTIVIVSLTEGETAREIVRYNSTTDEYTWTDSPIYVPAFNVQDTVWEVVDDIVTSFIVQKTSEEFYTTKKIQTHQITSETTYPSGGMSAFDLRLYALQYVEDVKNYSAYNRTFEPESNVSGHVSTVIENITDSTFGVLSDIKCIQHDFYPQKKDKICYLKNKFPIIARIIPQYKLQDLQIEDVTKNIIQALCQVFNAKEVEFGEEIPYDLVYDTILNSDERIRTLALDNIEYITFAEYYDSGASMYKEVAISDNFEDAYVCGELTADGFIPSAKYVGTNVKNPSLLYLDSVSGAQQDESSRTNIIYKYDARTESYVIYSSKINDFRNEIYAKSVLNGNTQLLHPDTTYDYNLGQKCVLDSGDIQAVTTNADLTVAITDHGDSINVYSASDKDVTLVIGNSVGLSNSSDLRDVVVPETLQLKLTNNGSTFNIYGTRVHAKNEFGVEIVNQFELQSDSNLFESGVLSLKVGSANSSSTTCQIRLTDTVADDLSVEASYEFYRDSITENTTASYTLGKNESIRFFAPNFLSKDSYTLIRYQFKLNPINVQSFEVKDGEVESTSGKTTIHPVVPNTNVVNTTFSNLLFKCTNYVDATKTSTWKVYGYNDDPNHTEEIDEADFSFSSIYNSRLYTVYGVCGILMTGERLIINENDYFAFNNISHTYEPKIIPANTDYQLETGESITFYWKDAEAEDDAPYNYRRYDAGDIIQSSIKLNSEKSSTDTPDGSGNYFSYYVGEHLVDPQGVLSSQNIIKVYNKSKVEEYNYNSYIKSLVTSQYNLTASQMIYERAINSVSVKDSSDRCYWILNNVSNDGTYELFTNNSTEYILKTGEYFIYTNKAMTQLIMLGSGTKIVRSTSSSTASYESWKVSPVSYDDIIERGIEGFSIDNWFKIPQVWDVNITEMQYITLNEGITLRMTPTKSCKLMSIVFDNSGYTVWADPGNKESMKLSDFLIEYKDVTDSQWTQLTNIAVGSGESWDAYSSLSLNLSSTDSQSLLGNHRIECWSSDIEMLSTTEPTFTILGCTPTPVQLLCNKSLSLFGGKQLITVEQNATGENEYIKFYSFVDGKNTEDDDLIYYDDHLNINLSNNTDDPARIQKEFTFRLPVGNYILTFRNLNEKNVESLQIYCNDEAMSPINSYFYDFSDYGIYYLKLDIVEAIDLKIRVDAFIKENSVVTVNFVKPFKYNKSNDFDTERFTILFNKVIELDHEQTYNYTYVVDPDEMIENPLDPNSFMDKNHIYNQYTICQIDTNNSDIYITSKIK